MADALNAVAATRARRRTTRLLSQASIGAIAGVTTVLDKYWNASAQATAAVPFPFPSMAGSGDRMAICWAVFGKAPDLSIGLDPPQHGVLYHSCQAFDYTATDRTPAPTSARRSRCSTRARARTAARRRAAAASCNRSAAARNCSTKVMADTAIGMRTFGGGCNPFAGPAYSAPGDNKCATFGGCAVPISASQLFPKTGTMDLFVVQRVRRRVEQHPGHPADHVRQGPERARRGVGGVPASDEPRRRRAGTCRRRRSAWRSRRPPSLPTQPRTVSRLGVPALGDGVGLRDVALRAPDVDAARRVGSRLVRDHQRELHRQPRLCRAPPRDGGRPPAAGDARRVAVDRQHRAARSRLPAPSCARWPSACGRRGSPTTSAGPA